MRIFLHIIKSPLIRMNMSLTGSFSLKRNSILLQLYFIIFRWIRRSWVIFQLSKIGIWWRKVRLARYFFSSKDFKIRSKSFFTRTANTQSSSQIMLASLGFLLIKAISPKKEFVPIIFIFIMVSGSGSSSLFIFLIQILTDPLRII